MNTKHSPVDMDRARKIIAAAERDLRRVLSVGERRDLLKDNTDWPSDRCDEVVLVLAVRS